MIEMGMKPEEWRGMTQADREYLLAVKRTLLAVESHEMADARDDAPAGHAGGFGG